MNDLIEYKSWWRINIKWIITLLVIVVVVVSTSKVGENTAQISKAYTDVFLYGNAFKIAKENEEVKELLGALQPIDKMAILEGYTQYLNTSNSVVTKIRVKGAKGKGMIDIYAHKKEGDWDYEKINIRMREPKYTIIVLEK